MSISHQSTGQKFSIPVLLIIFNRPDTTKKVFEAIRNVRPAKLYVAADGPRSDKSGEAEQSEAARAIIEKVDWECEVKTLFQEKNLGCGVGPATAISWLFEHEKMGIILEDDCLPGPSFFWYCKEVLEKYENDTRVMQVSGMNPHQGWKNDLDYDYYFSEAGTTWGWATWKRAWKLYDYSIPLFKEIKDKRYIESFHFYRQQMDWVIHCMEESYQKLPHVTWWDFQWEFTKFINSGLSIVPIASLVKNIGFGQGATHTFDPVKYALSETTELKFPLRHPPFIVKDRISDERYYQQNMRKNFLTQLKRKVKTVFS